MHELTNESWVDLKGVKEVCDSAFFRIPGLVVRQAASKSFTMRQEDVAGELMILNKRVCVGTGDHSWELSGINQRRLHLDLPKAT